MHSLYRGFPVGGLLVWDTPAGGATLRGGSPSALSTVRLLLDGHPETVETGVLLRDAPLAPESDEDREIAETDAWILAQGLPGGERGIEIGEPNSEPQAILDLAWPSGLQTGFSGPVALMIEESEAARAAARAAGYLVFTDGPALRDYAAKNILVEPTPTEG